MRNRDLIEEARAFIVSPMEGKDHAVELLRATGLIERLADELALFTGGKARGVRCRHCEKQITATYDSTGVVWRDHSHSEYFVCSESPGGHGPAPEIEACFVAAYDVIRAGGSKDDAAHASGLQKSVIQRAFPSMKVRAEA